ncbi:conserved hypothetical protein [Uncinocarpus reesii 1704]|uniref:ERCC4 domain-containing protein n=1 Tax=Uncinocarpus reesii (strain UAMH 1704) TaxID=336963 RepID=C4JQA5_UNCRE|nr:uncharacterized protein UREG_04659 [Uncinocarpus reesii 1704]EEP79813.1 conserved hypothetical protein [Uncinocarpus reesii 1704]
MSNTKRKSRRNGGTNIDKRDFDANRSLLGRVAHSEDIEYDRRTGVPGRSSTDSDGLLSDVVSEIVDRDREMLKREMVRVGSFIWGVLTASCAGSITGFSIYGPLLLSRLHYSQFRVNTVAVAAEMTMYLPVPLFGYLCDRYSPGPVALLSAFLFGPGYLLAALTFRSGPPPDAGGSGWPYWVMILAFLGVGAGTASMYLAAVSTCAKNFAQSKHKGLMLAMPIAAFGLSGMWQSQVGRHLLCEWGPNGEKGDVDVFKYFLFLAILLFSVGLVGSFALRLVDEEKLIDEAVEELERSGYLDESSFFRPREEVNAEYGTFGAENNGTVGIDDGDGDSVTSSQEEKQKKTWLLNQETKLFLRDRTMWWLAAGFFLASGPGEAYINNVGTVIHTLTPSSYPPNLPPPAGHPSLHVTIIALTSTAARLLTGSLSDAFAPTSRTRYQSQEEYSPVRSKRRLTLSRLAFLIPSALLLSLGYLYLSTPFPLQHPSSFVTTTTLVGFGYGAIFSLVPIIISVVWGVENFGTNWGIVAMVPALGATLWGMVYSAGYEAAIELKLGDTGRLIDYFWKLLTSHLVPTAHGPPARTSTYDYIPSALVHEAKALQPAMAEVISLLSSPETCRPHRSRKSSTSKHGLVRLSNDLLSDILDDSLLELEEIAQPPKRRKLDTALDIPSSQNRLATHTVLSSFISNDSFERSGSYEIRKSTLQRFESWNDEISDPVLSSPRRINTSYHEISKRSTNVIKIDDSFDDIVEDDLLGDPFQFSPPPASQSAFSDRTSGLLAKLRDQPARGSKKGRKATASVQSSDEDIPLPRPNRTKPKRATQKTDSDKASSALEKEAAKLRRQKEKEEEKERKRKLKEEKEKAKKLASDIAQANKLKINKKESTPEMLIDLSSTFQGSSIGTQVNEYMRHLEVQTNFIATEIPNIVSWRRKVTAIYNDEAGHWEPCPLRIEKEGHVLCFLTAQNFVDLVASSGASQTVESHFQNVIRHYPGCKIIYLIEGLFAYMRKNQNIRNRAYQAAVLRQIGDSHDATTEQRSSSRRSAKTPAPSAIDDDRVEDALLQLQIQHHCLIYQTATAAETAEWIKNFTEHISTIPYRRERISMQNAAFCMDTGQVKTGTDADDTYIKMLEEIQRITAPIAYGVAMKYSNVRELVNGMKAHGPLSLQDVKKCANKSGALTEARIGPAVSKRLHKIFTSVDPCSADI